jgi:hypothetical protein
MFLPGHGKRRVTGWFLVYWRALRASNGRIPAQKRTCDSGTADKKS